MSYKKSQLINALVTLTYRLNKIPTARDMCSANGVPSAGTYRKHFGSFSNAIVEAGLKPEDELVINRYTDKTLIDLIVLFKLQKGRFPTYTEFNRKNSLASAKTYIARFGSVGSSIKLAMDRIRNDQDE
jgi:hypothetical protein